MDAIQKPLPVRQAGAARSKEEITSFIEQWRASGKDKTVFCRENNLNYMTFIGWMCRREKQKAKQSFIPLDKNQSPAGFIPLSIPASEIFAEVNLRGAKIIFHREVSAQYLKSILR